ncbi:MAG TPA: hemerythrin domain-containing protein [Anaeromyxobacteraceae bacterium]|nr:hemerythrin domain-containing protein [Anaeromyxobacteraceae bacterium]
MPVEWTPELTVNDELLDRHHVEMFRALGAAAGAVGEGREVEAREAVARFADTFVEHVAVEEGLMEETLWPERDRHRAAHELFGADLLLMRAELEQSGPTPAVTEWVTSRAPEWLRFHIRTNDAPFAAYLARRRMASSGPAARREIKRH